MSLASRHARPLRSSGLLGLVALAGLAACDGTLRERVRPGGVDGGPLDEVPLPACDAPATATAPTLHHAGEDCLACHHQGGPSPPFTFAGTLYADAAGGAPVVGATIHLIDANGADVTAVTLDNGNFYSTEFVHFPVRAFASRCPSVLPMTTPLEGASASCNAAGCHAAGVRLHLP